MPPTALPAQRTASAGRQPSDRQCCWQRERHREAQELRSAIEPRGDGTPFDQLTASIDAYLAWIEQNSEVWVRQQTMNTLLRELIGQRAPRPALRIAIRGWLGYMDAATLDWTSSKDVPRGKLRDLLLAALGVSLLAAQQADPKIRLAFD